MAAATEPGVLVAERIREGLGGDQAYLEWPSRLSTVIRTEAEGEDGRAVMELFVGARTSPALAAIDYATTEMEAELGESPITQLIPVAVIAELAAAAFLGMEVLAQNGREMDLDKLTTSLSAGVQLLTLSRPAPGAAPLPPAPAPGGWG